MGVWNRLDLTGQRFGSWSVLQRADRQKTKYGEIYWLCRCDCGTEKDVVAASLTKGLSRRCGIGQCSASYKHGMEKSRAYVIWAGMKQRCTNPEAASFSRYGARGITYDPRWESFGEFYADMGDPPTGMSLERNDNDLGYSKENCRWATSKEQMRNRAVTAKVDVGGFDFPLPLVADALKISRQLLTARIKQGWSVRLTLSK